MRAVAAYTLLYSVQQRLLLAHMTFGKGAHHEIKGVQCCIRILQHVQKGLCSHDQDAIVV